MNPSFQTKVYENKFFFFFESEQMKLSYEIKSDIFKSSRYIRKNSNYNSEQIRKCEVNEERGIIDTDVLVHLIFKAILNTKNFSDCKYNFNIILHNTLHCFNNICILCPYTWVFQHKDCHKDYWWLQLCKFFSRCTAF